MNARLLDDFNKLIEKLKTNVPLPRSVNWVGNAGRHNHFTSVILNNHYEAKGTKRASLPVAFTLPKYQEDVSRTCEPINLLKKLSEEKTSLDLTFIHTYFYFGEQGKFAEQAECDIFEYKHKDWIDIKSWVAQLTLAVYELHRHGLVHRDIKPENILLFIYSDKMQHLKLADLDDIEFENKVTKIAGTPVQFSPEMCYHWNEMSSQDKQTFWDNLPVRIKKGYWQSLSIKQQAILFIGLSDQQKETLLRRLLPRTIKKLNSLIEQKEIIESKEDICWQKAADLNRINEDKYLELKTDKKKIDCYALGITFQFIAEKCSSKDKDLMQLIEGLTRPLPEERFTIEDVLQHPFFGKEPKKYFDTMTEQYKIIGRHIDGYYIPNTNLLPEKDDSFYILPYSLKKIYMTACQLNNQLHFINTMHDDGIDRTTFTSVRNKSIKLKFQVDAFLKYAPQNELIIQLQETLFYITNPIEIKNLGLITTEQLSIAVSQAFAAYQKTAVSTLHRFFKKDPANGFIEQLNEKNKEPPYDFFALISYYLTQQKDRKPRSFPAILVKNLQTLSELPLNDWDKYLSRKNKLKEDEHLSLSSSQRKISYRASV
jgi:serine/threonine protein kinase